jgi:hypothetical protein
MRQSLMGVAAWPETGSGRGTWPTAFLKTPSRNSQGWADGNGGPNGTEDPSFSASGACPGGPGLAQSITATLGQCSRHGGHLNYSRQRRNLNSKWYQLDRCNTAVQDKREVEIHHALHNDHRRGGPVGDPSTWLWLANGQAHPHAWFLCTAYCWRIRDQAVGLPASAISSRSAPARFHCHPRHFQFLHIHRRLCRETVTR